MSTLIPLLSREHAREVLASARPLSVEEAAATMPLDDVVTALNPVGGMRVERRTLVDLRDAVVEMATEHGYPGPGRDIGAFEARVAGLLHERLSISAHEASTEEAWSYLTCCWLLDVAIWRFGGEADERRFIGNLNRNTFRRLWWRARVLSDDPRSDPSLFHGLGEDELVNLMERPTIAANPELARTVVRGFVGLLEQRAELAPLRMSLMRELMKRLFRLTPFVDLDGLGPAEMDSLIREQLALAVAGLSGDAPVSQPSPEPAGPTENVATNGAELAPAVDRAEIEHAAVEVATRLGQVTNGRLRELQPALSAAEAREILVGLVDAGLLERRGTARGSHYVPVVKPSRGAGPRGRNVGTVLRKLLDDRRRG